MKKKWLLPLLQRRVFVALLVIAQVALCIYFVINGSQVSSVFAHLLPLLSVFVSLFILSGKGENAYKLTWIFVIMVFPLVGGVLYLLLDGHFLRFYLIRRTKRATAKALSHMHLAGGYEHLEGEKLPPSVRYLTGYAGFPAYEEEETTFLSSGKEMHAALLEELRRAKDYIFMEYFIIEQGEMWESIHEILLEKAKAGVTVRIIYDDMGCFLRLPHSYARQLRREGIHLACFNPFVPFFSAEQNNRDHRKITVIDGKVAFTGGVNLADEYIGRVRRFGEWADSAILVRGRAAWSFALMFLQMWSIIHKNKPEDLLRYLPKEYAPLKVAYDGNVAAPQGGLVLPYADSPLDNENVGELVYMQIIQNARRYVYITTPYLVIDDQLLGALTLAAKSGVDVRIVTPHRWDKWSVHMTTRSYYYELWKSGVQIYEYTPGFMHAKLVVADDEIATVGSINFDYRSLYLHFECGTYLYRTQSVSKIKQTVLDHMAVSEAIIPKKPKRNPISRLCRAVMRLFSPLL